MNKKLLENIPVTVHFSRESQHRPGHVTITEKNGTIKIRQTLLRTEQSESDQDQTVYIPRGLLEALFEKYVYDS